MNLHQMGAEKMPVKMPETFDSMRISSIFHNPSFTDSGVFPCVKIICSHVAYAFIEQTLIKSFDF